MAADFMLGMPADPEVLRVLLVDGDAGARNDVTQALGNAYEVRQVRTIAEALGTLEAGQPHVIISEVDLPDGSGLTFFQRVRTMPRGDDLPLILLTTRDSARDKIAGFDAGADDYLVKPFDPQLLPSRVRLLFRIRSFEQPASFPF